MIKTNNRSARKYVIDRIDFKATSTFGKWESDNIYCVYSFGTHWIMYMNINGVWLGCGEKRSQTTTKHTTQLHPNAEIVEWFTQNRIKEIYLENVML